MTRRAFTLLELLVVIAIMGMMGAMSVGGYRAMRRGMQERAVMDGVNRFIRAAYNRAQMDRQPVYAYFWNETLASAADSDDGIGVVVGRAVAVRRYGRLTTVQGSYLYDEFGDLRYSSLQSDDGDDSYGQDDSSEYDVAYLYRMNGDESDSSIVRSPIRVSTAYNANMSTEPLLFRTGGGGNSATFGGYYFLKDQSGAGSGERDAEWRPGDAYGLEFADLTLPKGYIFGSSTPSTGSGDVGKVQNPKAFHFGVAANSGSGTTGGYSGFDLAVSSLRGGENGAASAKKVANAEKPDAKMSRLED